MPDAWGVESAYTDSDGKPQPVSSTTIERLRVVIGDPEAGSAPLFVRDGAAASRPAPAISSWRPVVSLPSTTACPHRCRSAITPSTAGPERRAVSSLFRAAVTSLSIGAPGAWPHSSTRHARRRAGGWAISAISPGSPHGRRSGAQGSCSSIRSPQSRRQARNGRARTSRPADGSTIRSTCASRRFPAQPTLRMPCNARREPELR